VNKKLLSFEVEQARRGAYSRSDRGLRMVPVARVVGSVGRADALDGRFRYRRGVDPHGADSRIRRVRQLFDAGRVPPVDLYRVAAPGELDFMGVRDLLDDGALVLVEWPERGGRSIPGADVDLALAHATPGRVVVLSGRTAAGKTLLGMLTLPGGCSLLR